MNPLAIFHIRLFSFYVLGEFTIAEDYFKASTLKSGE